MMTQQWMCLEQLGVINRFLLELASGREFEEGSSLQTAVCVRILAIQSKTYGTIKPYAIFTFNLNINNYDYF